VNYSELTPGQIASVAAQCAGAWQDPQIPSRQSEVALPEIEKFRNGQPVAPFDAFIRCWNKIPPAGAADPKRFKWNVLDVGASAGYYREVLRIAGAKFIYKGIDFSPEFITFAQQVYPGIDIELGDAIALKFENDEFGVVLSSGCVMHVAEYEKAIREAARVARQYVIFNRTPITDGPTRYFCKEAYGVQCLEIWFNEADLIRICADAGLRLVYSTDVDSISWHRSYLLEKYPIEPYASNPNV
jgi:SAM-dependent methyltransferase